MIKTLNKIGVEGKYLNIIREADNFGLEEKSLYRVTKEKTNTLPDRCLKLLIFTCKAYIERKNEGNTKMGKNSQ